MSAAARSSCRVPAFYADPFTHFPDLHLEITWRYVSDGAIIEIVEEIPAAVAAHRRNFAGVPH